MDEHEDVWPSVETLASAKERRDQLVGDADRDAVCDRLASHFAAGRLTPDELDLRLEAAVAATTRQQLNRLTTDLPDHSPRRSSTPSRADLAARDRVALALLLGTLAVSGGLLLVLGLLNLHLFAAAAVGGLAAALAGASATYLAMGGTSRTSAGRSRRQESVSSRR